MAHAWNCYFAKVEQSNDSNDPQNGGDHVAECGSVIVLDSRSY